MILTVLESELGHCYTSVCIFSIDREACPTKELETSQPSGLRTGNVAAFKDVWMNSHFQKHDIGTKNVL